ncbi:MAG: cytochrome c biogenesis protein CcdA [Archangium sp.]|nr:cytochrome c biogenesis protein CcdA [Archangium sp.]
MTSLLTTFGDAFAGAPWLALLAAFAWGALSVVLSPCHLTSIPLVVAYVNGDGVPPPFRRGLGLSSLFALGTLASIAVIGLLTVLAGRVAGDVGPVGTWLVAGVFIVMGLNLLGVVPLPQGLAGPSGSSRKGPVGALLLGLLFGVALGPCTFAFMGPLLGLAFRSGSTQGSLGVWLIVLYGLGHAGLIALAGASTGLVQRLLNWNSRERGARWLKHGSGVAVILGGLYFLWTAR